MRFRSIVPAAALLVAGLSFSTSNASLISIAVSNDGGATKQLVSTDGGSGNTGVNGYSYGTFTINNLSATGSPVLASGTLNTSSLNVSSSGGGTLYVYITEQGLMAPTGLTSFLSGFTANITGGTPTITETTYYSNANALYGGTQLDTKMFTTSNAAGVTKTSLATLAGTYSETVIYEIATTGAASVNDTINLTATAATPEPSSLALLGTGLVGAASMALRRRKLIA